MSVACAIINSMRVFVRTSMLMCVWLHVFRFAGSHLQMELLRDGSPGSSAEVRVSNRTRAHTHVYVRFGNPLVNVRTLCLNRH